MEQVEVGVTHQIKIGREDAWIKVSVTLDNEDESIAKTIDRASAVVNQKIFDVINQTVNAVEKYERSDR